MSVAFRRPDAVVATVAQSRARTPGTSSTGQEMTKALEKRPDNRCTRCQGTACPLDGRPQKEVQVGPDKLEVVASFCYLGDMLSAAGGCELSTTTRVKTASVCSEMTEQ